MATDKNHKASFVFGVAARCACGWSGATFFGEGAKANAASEWRWHRDSCHDPVREWDVYCDGKYKGTVHAIKEAGARLAAMSRYDLGACDEISVNPRD